MAAPNQAQCNGPQDRELTMNPTMSLFKKHYQRHTPFAQEPKEIHFQNNAAWGRTITAPIARNADLLAKLYLVIDLEPLNGGQGGAGVCFTDDVGRAMIESVTMEMGSVQFDCLYPEWMHAWEEITVPSDRQLRQLTGQCPSDAERERWARNKQRLYVPLKFWFHGDYASAIPLISMHLTDAKIKIKLKEKKDCIHIDYRDQCVQESDGRIADMYLLGEYVYLDDPERKMMIDTTQQYLLHQHQMYSHTIPAGKVSETIPISFNHPTKEFVLVFRTETSTNKNQWFNFTGLESGQYDGEAFKSMSVTLNNNDRVKARDPLYYRILQTAEHHTRISDKHVYTYSFAVQPEINQPSGTLNLSRIERTAFVINFSEKTTENVQVFIFARSLNSYCANLGVAQLKWAS